MQPLRFSLHMTHTTDPPDAIGVSIPTDIIKRDNN